MAELVYHDGHYHEVSRRDLRHKKRDDSWNVMKVWDEVLYNIGDLYYKHLHCTMHDRYLKTAAGQAMRLLVPFCGRHLILHPSTYLYCTRIATYEHAHFVPREEAPRSSTAPDSRLPDGPHPSSSLCAVAPRKRETGLANH
ncbi:hypothetical protein HDV63DRAFT_384312 [Trichoderma sp. SZMC 28014]